MGKANADQLKTIGFTLVELKTGFTASELKTDFTLEELESRLISEGYKKFNARQIFEWLYKKKVTKFSEMSNLSKALREHLETKYSLEMLTVAEHQVSSDGTEKFLINGKRLCLKV